MICSNCGKKLLDGALFCNQCGTPVHITSVPEYEESVLTAAESKKEYSNSAKTAAIILSLLALVFALVPRLATHVYFRDTLAFAVIPGITMLIF